MTGHTIMTHGQIFTQREIRNGKNYSKIATQRCAASNPLTRGNNRYMVIASSGSDKISRLLTNPRTGGTKCPLVGCSGGLLMILRKILLTKCSYSASWIVKYDGFAQAVFTASSNFSDEALSSSFLKHWKSDVVTVVLDILLCGDSWPTELNKEGVFTSWVGLLFYRCV